MAEDAPPVTTEEVAPADAPTVEDAPAKEVASDNSAPEVGDEASAAATAAEENEGAEAATEEAPAAADKAATPTSAKKKTPAKALARKRSLANLKKNTPKKAAAVDKRFEAGDYVIARMKSYPPWPAIVLNEELLPESLKKGPGRGGAKTTDDKGLGASAWKTQYPIFFLGTYEYAWTSVADLDQLTDEILEAGPSRKNKKFLPEAFEEVKSGWTLKEIKEIQDGTMEIDEPAADDDADEMEVDEEEEDEPPSEDERPKKKRGTKRKKSESASDDEDAEPEKPAKTPKKAASKAKTPKSAAKAKTPKTPANGVKSKAAASSVKKSATKKNAKKSTEIVEESASEADSEKSQFANVEDLTDVQKEEIMMHRRHKLQKCLLNKDKTVPGAEEMPAMDKYLKSLESWPNVTGILLKNTKIHKVLKGVMKKKDDEIPLDDKYKFRERCRTLYEAWNKLVVELDATEASKEKENGVAAATTNGDITKDDEATTSKSEEKEVAVGKDAPSAASVDKENANDAEKGKTAAAATTEEGGEPAEKK